MVTTTTFQSLLDKYRKAAFNERDKGERFERLVQAYLLTDPKYSSLLKKIWLWNEFPGKLDLGGSDMGIDLVALTVDGDYWAIQCKCYQENTVIDKPAVDSFLSTSSRGFKDENQNTVAFSQRLWVSTTNKWGPNATEAIKNQNPPVTRINLYDLIEAPVDWNKLDQGITGELSRAPKKSLFNHQKDALDKTHEHFKTADRGKLIMACGTGKTFNSLRIAENETDGKGLILFLVPGIALLGQTLREWSANANEPINAVCICSDPEISKKKSKNEDADTFSIVDLALPASTNVNDIIHQFRYIAQNGNKGLTVVFSTYQSIEVIAKAQKEIAKISGRFAQFDLIVCDEAHRTTGVTLSGEDESAFTKVHDNSFIKSKKRLYMTATPRLYSDDSKSRAARADAVLCSMDDTSLYGDEIYRIGFGEAVERDLLTDYKVLVFTLNEKDIPPAVQKIITNEESEINTDDASKLIGCINSLSKQILGDEGVIKNSDPEPMRRAVAFCQNIASSKKITNGFNTATSAYINSLPSENKEKMVSVGSRHIDGTMTAPQRDELLGWLKEDGEENECRILTNVRCLSEGVDVPSLDAVMFLSARNSQVDVVQSVGRVMRKSPGKKYGYIVIPVVIPSDVEANKALDDNERYKVVWTVLNALRAHDDRFNAIVNKIDLNKNRPDQILIGRPEISWEDGKPILLNGETEQPKTNDLSQQLAVQFEQLQNVVFARMVQKVGDRRYWEQWAKNVAEIAERQVERITRLTKEDQKHRKELEDFLKGLQKNINPGITEQEAIDMLSQHIITKPVFEALFEGYSFVKNNPISVSMQKMLDLLEEQALEKDAETLFKFYESVKMRAAGIDNAEGRQRIIVELYDKFFKTAFPKMVERLGIVYTPVEVVDFVIHSVNDILKKEFGQELSDENVHILDPFTGTGTFITRLLQSGLIKEKDLERKYKYELHANEIVLLAYYIAAINIENAYHDQTPNPNDGIGKAEYIPFEGIVLTDTFQLGETDNEDKLFSEMFPQNSKRVQKQKEAPLRIVMGNPPYSIGQKSENDNAQNQSYVKLENRISQSYVKLSNAGLKNSMYDSYIKAFRWGTDRLDDKKGGIICFVSNGSWIDGNAADGFRKSLEREFTSIYIFNLRGNQRTSGELSRKEGGKIFGSGSRTPISITLLVKNPNIKKEKATIYYHDIGDYLSKEDKLGIIKEFKSIGNKKIVWTILKPNEHGDWINQRNDSFETFIQLGGKGKTASGFFKPIFSNGIKSQRDSWTYNSSKTELYNNMHRMIENYNNQVELFRQSKLDIEEFPIDTDPRNINWTVNLKRDLQNLVQHEFSNNVARVCLYRPYFKQLLYYDKAFIERPGLNSTIYPIDFKNLSICVPSSGDSKEFSTVITNTICDYGFLSGAQCFSLYYYEKNETSQKGLFDENANENYTRKDSISDFILERAKKQYGKNVSKEDIFYYVYGFLHSPEYRETFASDLKKMLPRLPLVDDVKDFWTFSKAGRQLADLHINYETVAPFEGTKLAGAEKGNFQVEKMRFPKKDQKDTIVYNSSIIIQNIPEKAYEYVVNGKSAVEWIMERYQVSTHKESGIRNDPNDWAKEVGNPRYILDLLLSIINVSIKTVEIVENLPALNFKADSNNLSLNDFISIQFGQDPKWQTITGQLESRMQARESQYMHLSDFEEIAKRSNIELDDILAIVGLLSLPENKVFKQEFSSLKDGNPIKTEEVYEKLRDYWKHKSMNEEDWQNWAQQIEMKWKIQSKN